MSEQKSVHDGNEPQAPQPQRPSLLDGVKYLCAEDLISGDGEHRKATLKIKEVRKAMIGHGRNAQEGWEFHFEGTPKIYGLTGKTVRRQIVWATGEKDPAKMVGKRITFYVVESKSPLAATGYALRVCPPDAGRKK